MQNIACLGKVMSLFNKHHLATFKTQFTKKLSNTEAEFKKGVAYKKKRVLEKNLDNGCFWGKPHVRNTTLFVVICKSTPEVRFFIFIGQRNPRQKYFLIKLFFNFLLFFAKHAVVY